MALSVVLDFVSAVFWIMRGTLRGWAGSVTLVRFWTVVRELSGLVITSCQLQGALSVARGLVSSI